VGVPAGEFGRGAERRAAERFLHLLRVFRLGAPFGLTAALLGLAGRGVVAQQFGGFVQQRDVGRRPRGRAVAAQQQPLVAGQPAGRLGQPLRIGVEVAQQLSPRRSGASTG